MANAKVALNIVTTLKDRLSGDSGRLFDARSG